MKKLFLILLTMFTLSGCGLHTVADDTRNDPIPTDQVDDDADDDSSEDATDSDTAADDTNSSPKVYEAEDVVVYFNTAAPDDIKVVYDEQEDYWYYTCVEHTVDDTKDAVYYYLDFLPLYKVKENGYMFRLKEHYNVDTDTYTYVAVSSNWFAAATIRSYTVSSEIRTDVLIYDGRNKIYE